MIINLAQMRRVVFRKKASAGADWDVFVIDKDDLGQDTVATVNVAPRKQSRASQQGTTETPISGTFDALAASITFLMDNYKILGKALQNWTASTYVGADANAGQILFGEDSSVCNDDAYYSVILQGVCDDGSAVDVEITRCIPSVDDDIEFGGSDTPELTLNLNPQIYNSAKHSADGYPQYTVRFGENDPTKKQRLNVTSGVYADVTES